MVLTLKNKGKVNSISSRDTRVDDMAIITADISVTSSRVITGTNNRVVCEADGLFSVPEAFCQLTCDSPPVVANAELLTTSCLRAGPYIVGTACKYQCAEGYHVVGDIHR